MRKIKYVSLSIFDLYMLVICLFPIFTVLSNEGIMNKLLFGMLVLLHACLIFYCRFTMRSLCEILLMLVLYAITLTQTTFPVSNINLLFYYPFCILYLMLWNDNMERFQSWFRNHEIFITGIIVVWTIGVGVSVLLPSSYYIKEGGALYFGSFCGDIFRLGPSCFFIQVLVLILMSYFKRRKAIFFMILPMYSYLMGSSRAYLVIGTFLFVLAWYWFGVSRKVFFATIIPMAALGGYLLMRSAMMEKILYTLNENRYGDFWFRISSSRNVIWSGILDEYAQRPVLGKLFGNGIDFSMKTVGLWSHNDFIEIATSFGFVGMMQYIITMVRTIKKYEPARKTVPLMVKGLVIWAWLFNAVFNMHYIYFCCSLSFPFLILAVRNYYTKESG